MKDSPDLLISFMNPYFYYVLYTLANHKHVNTELIQYLINVCCKVDSDQLIAKSF